MIDPERVYLALVKLGIRDMDREELIEIRNDLEKREQHHISLAKEIRELRIIIENRLKELDHEHENNPWGE